MFTRFKEFLSDANFHWRDTAYIFVIGVVLMIATQTVEKWHADYEQTVRDSAPASEYLEVNQISIPNFVEGTIRSSATTVPSRRPSAPHGRLRFSWPVRTLPSAQAPTRPTTRRTRSCQRVARHSIGSCSVSRCRTASSGRVTIGSTCVGPSTGWMPLMPACARRATSSQSTPRSFGRSCWKTPSRRRSTMWTLIIGITIGVAVMAYGWRKLMHKAEGTIKDIGGIGSQPPKDPS